MNATDPTAGDLSDVLTKPARGVAGVVDDLLGLCPAGGLRLRWRQGGCSVAALGPNPTELAHVAVRKSAFRAILARVAVLCDPGGGPASPYEGQGTITAAGGPGRRFRVAFVNTADDQRCDLIPAEAGAAGAVAHPSPLGSAFADAGRRQGWAGYLRAAVGPLAGLAAGLLVAAVASRFRPPEVANPPRDGLARVAAPRVWAGELSLRGVRGVRVVPEVGDGAGVYRVPAGDTAYDLPLQVASDRTGGAAFHIGAAGLVPLKWDNRSRDGRVAGDITLPPETRGGWEAVFVVLADKDDDALPMLQSSLRQLLGEQNELRLIRAAGRPDAGAAIRDVVGPTLKARPWAVTPDDILLVAHIERVPPESSPRKGND